VNLPYLLAKGTLRLRPDPVPMTVGPSLAINAGLNVSQVAAWYLAIALYRATRPEPVETAFA